MIYLLSADEVMANILHLTQSTEEELSGTDITAQGGHAPPPSSHSSRLAVGHTVDGAPQAQAAAEDAASRTSAAAVAASNTSCRHAQPQMAPS
jgi:hypothetical protein